jgi:hypothetical protein
MKQMKRAWFIAVKDLRLFAVDRLALFFGLLFPFFLATAFYFVMQGVGGGMTKGSSFTWLHARQRA